MIYKKVMGLVLRKIENKFYILKNNSLYEVNEIGARIISLCDGANSIEDISEKLKQIYACSQENVDEDIRKYIEVLVNLGVILKID